MKRAADELEREPKRQKRGAARVAINWDDMHELSPTDLLNWTPGEPAYISGKICMKWPPVSGKYRVKVEIFSLAAGSKQLEVAFTGPSAVEFQRERLEFRMGQKLRLSLKGAVKETVDTQRITLPVALKYHEGVMLEIFPHGTDPGRTIDTWWSEPQLTEEPVEQPSAVDSDDWFATPRHTKLPALGLHSANMTDIDEEPSPVVASPSPPAKPASVPPRNASAPLNNIGNALHAATPSHPPISGPSSSSHTVRSIPPAASSVRPKENPLNSSATKPPSVPLQRNGPPPPANGTASSSKIPTAAPVVAAERATRSGSASDTAEGQEQILNKKQRKNKQRREKRKNKGDPLPGAPPDIAPAVGSLPAQRQPTAPAPATTATSAVTCEPQPSSSRPEPDPPTTPPAEVRLRKLIPKGFTAISDFKAPPGVYKEYSVIGVVTHISSVSTARDLSCSLRIVDPSNCDESFLPTRLGTEGFMLNCFTKKYAKWLPSASEGSVIILYKIKTTTYGDNVVGNGYHDKLQWAVYDPTTGQIGHGDLGGAPESERLADGYGANFTPFYTGTEDDLIYCKALDEWWHGVSEKRLAAMGTIHQIGDQPSATLSRAPRRRHKLIEDTEIDEYFDCTIKVIDGYPTDSGPYSLYVTDATVVDGSKPCLRSICPPSLVERVLQIEMWDGARLLAPTMLPGEYYYLKNVRMMRGKDGTTEAKMSEPKIRKIEPDADLPTLKELLERLKPHGDIDELKDVEIKLIEHGQDRDFMDCLVELLHTDKSKNAIYVTDYTAHPRIPAIKEPWAVGLDGCVLKVVLYDQQIARIQDLVVGQYYTLINLRLKQASSSAQDFRGALGGSELLILPVNPKSSSVGEWKEALVQYTFPLLWLS
ncbi:hypothetical protein DFH06DRAFT_1289373 [Mycena polygramma]|nr:hypothetical protein DFH06DRAFT_1289373 [Mycena polygramma]